MSPTLKAIENCPSRRVEQYHDFGPTDPSATLLPVTTTPPLPSKTRYFVGLAAALVTLSTALTGCYSGFHATTNMESVTNSSNGTQTQIGPIRIENATLVLGPAVSKTATLLTTFVNQGPSDTLMYAEINGKPVYVTPGATELKAGAAVSFGSNSQTWINSYDFTAPVSTYVPVVLQFKNAGIAAFSALVVPPLDYYEGVAPSPTALPAG